MIPLDFLFGSFLAPKMAENCLEIRLGPAKSRSRAFFSGSEASKSDPRGKKEGSKKGAKNGPPKGPPVSGYGGRPGGIWDPGGGPQEGV